MSALMIIPLMNLNNSGSLFLETDEELLSEKKEGCAKHGGKTANHKTGECRTKEMFHKRSRLNGNRKVPTRVYGKKMKGLCFHCKKETWSPTHHCNEFHDRKAKKKTVLAVSAGENRWTPALPTPVSAGESRWTPAPAPVPAVVSPWTPAPEKMKKSTEDVTYECKFKGNIHNEESSSFKLIIAPITARDKRLIARVDTGSDKSCINEHKNQKIYMVLRPINISQVTPTYV